MRTWRDRNARPSSSMQMTEFLGSHVSTLLENKPFEDWPVERFVEDDLDEREVHYVFHNHGLELCCDVSDNIKSIFLHSERFGGFDESVSGVPFSLRRRDVLELFGTPSKSGGKISDPILGEFGAWDRFSCASSAIHVEYKTKTEGIQMITLMRGDAVP